MKRFIPVAALVGLLSACGGDGTNPFTPPADPTEDPSTINSKFLFDVEDKLTMNSVIYDATNNELLINNLPFDGPNQRYEHQRLQNGVDIYRSIQTPTTGIVRSYAVFMRNDDAQVAAAVGERWVDFGYAGANVTRSAYGLPGGVGEYVYLGTYGGVRTRNDGASLELVTGNVELYFDELDFDENGDGTGEGTLEGAIVGNVRNRLRTDGNGNPIAVALPDVSLILVQYDPETGTFANGAVQTGFNGRVRDEGTWEGLISGAQGETLAGYLVMTGTAEMQLVRYEVVTWNDPATGASGVVSGYNSETQYDSILNAVNNGVPIPDLTADTSGIPSGAVQTSRFEEIVFESDADAREVGVFLTEVEPDDLTPIP